jgi:molybdopterin synthase catalytic subunit
MIEITDQPIKPETVIAQAKTDDSGCVVTYVGLIRNNADGKPVRTVEYQDTDGQAVTRLVEIATIARQKWLTNNIAIAHRTGVLKVGDINLVVAVAAAHRKEGLAACEYIINEFKDKLPTHKKETYRDGSVKTTP